MYYLLKLLYAEIKYISMVVITCDHLEERNEKNLKQFAHATRHTFFSVVFFFFSVIACGEHIYYTEEQYIETTKEQYKRTIAMCARDAAYICLFSEIFA